MRKKILACLFSVPFSLSSLYASDAPRHYIMDETVVTATLTQTPLKNIPAAVEVIDSEEIGKSGAMTLHQVLTEAQSVNLEAVSGRQSTARLRGLSSNNTLVMIDGMRLPSGFQDKIDLSEIPAGWIDRIEIVRGPASALYGSDAIGGVINVITRKPSEETEAWFSSRYGSNTEGEAEETSFDAGVSGRSGDVGYVITGSFGDKDRVDLDTSDGSTDTDDKNVKAGAATISWNVGEQTELSIGATYADVERQGLRFKNKKEQEWLNGSERYTGRIELRSDLGEDSSMLLRAYRSVYDWGVTLTPTGNGAPEVHSVEQTTDQFEARWSGVLPGGHKVTTGIEYRTEDREEDGLASEVENLGVFLQDEVAVTDRLSAILGLRFDDHSGFGSVCSPRVSAAYRVSDEMRIRGSYAEGFRAPSVFELYTGSEYTKRRILLPNPDLDPETSRTWEVGADFEHDWLALSVTAFRNDIDDMISEVFTGNYDGTIPINEARNISEAMTRGIELSGRVSLGSGFSIHDELTVLDGENKITGTGLPYLPEFSNVFKLAYRDPVQGFGGNVRVVTAGRQYTDAEASVKTDAYTLVNFSLSKSLTSRAEIYGGVDNLFDERVEDGYGNVYGPGSTGTFLYAGIGLNL
ncbi:MAG: TonB-dependent receptor [Prosthecochloris sp.]|nr:TonB-dependent receptor [Prosthecochloris sp.]